MAVLEWWIIRCDVFIMTRMAHVVCTEAVEDGHRAAVLAFPVNLSRSMLRTGGASSADFLQKAVLAYQVLGLCLALLSIVCLLFTVN